MHIVIISDPQHIECSNLTKARWAYRHDILHTCNHELKKRMCPPGYHTIALRQLMTTHALAHNSHHVPKGMSCHKVIVVITWRAHYFHDDFIISSLLQNTPGSELVFQILRQLRRIIDC